ncbi:MAG: hypothetical protein QG594_722 [Bacteroidota bacterium]|nr:hypothetical protein [Bacteroidota bacterium]
MNSFKTFRFSIILISLSYFVNAQNHLFDALVKNAQQENKKVLLYFSGSDWCAPCMKFKKTYINSVDFQEFSKNNLMLFNADFPRKKANQLNFEQTKENEALAEKYNSKGIFPYIVLLDGNGKILKKWESLPIETVLEFITQLK